MQERLNHHEDHRWRIRALQISLAELLLSAKRPSDDTAVNLVLTANPPTASISMKLSDRIIVLNGTEFTLGQKYRDEIQDVEGMAVAGCVYLTGCDQIQLASKDANGLPFTHWVDVTRIEAVDVEHRDGGPGPSMPSRHP